MALNGRQLFLAPLSRGGAVLYSYVVHFTAYLGAVTNLIALPCEENAMPGLCHEISSSHKDPARFRCADGFRRRMLCPWAVHVGHRGPRSRGFNGGGWIHSIVSFSLPRSILTVFTVRFWLRHSRPTSPIRLTSAIECGDRDNSCDTALSEYIYVPAMFRMYADAFAA
ncbi:hypothetical protein DFH07DRAFT_308857 [Mycena maculata]|uniref:Uncharacterized protein n=1 Tax=Mycena maculata TaxID=230809 RepID=A0AAD7HGY6_9AGAR|nr:hypothetical protein DFH07DRAFT_308857 [Mycena maculata]